MPTFQNTNVQQLGLKIKSLLVNDQKQTPKIIPPMVTDMLNKPWKEIDEVLDIDLNDALVIQEKGSVFYGYSKSVQSWQEVNNAYIKVKYWHPEADHIVMAATINGDRTCCDDGEHNVGFKLAKLLEDRDVRNTVIFVAREYGLIRMGPRRFHIYYNAATKALDKNSETL